MDYINRASLAELLFHLQRSKRYALISLLSLLLLASNSASIFFTQVPIPPKTSPEPSSFSPENVTGKSRKFFSLPSTAKVSSSVLYSEKEQLSRAKLKSHLSLFHRNQNLVVSTKASAVYRPERRKKHRVSMVKPFEVRVKEFFNASSPDSCCKLRFFMTWISPMESFGYRELCAINSLFNTHPNGCLIIASNSLDSPSGLRILKPLLNKGFKVTAVSPNFNYLFSNTPAEAWYNRLMQGNVNTGEVPLGQNLSNLLRLGLLYRFGGVYLDTDFIVLKNLGELRNVIGAQTIDLDSGNWSRLNNAVMIFDEGHPLLYKFIQEFALTFDGNKWGHNGPYLVSRVVSRVSGRPGYNFTVLPPIAFYPVDWSKIGRLFEEPRNLSHSKWLLAKLENIHRKSFAVHLWNKQSRGLKVEDGSIIQHLILSSGFLYNDST